MDLFNRQLDLGLNLDYDKEEQEETEFQERLKVYKLKFAKRFKIIKYSFFILQSVNVLILWSFLYWNFISKLTSKSIDTKKVYNLAMSKKIDNALLGIFVLIIANFVLIIANFILLCLLFLLKLSRNFLITLNKQFSNGYFSLSISG